MTNQNAKLWDKGCIIFPYGNSFKPLTVFAEQQYQGDSCKNYGTENSTIKTTAVDWKNWKASYKDLKNWLGPKATLRERFWLRAVKLRWKVSYRKRRAGN